MNQLRMGLLFLRRENASNWVRIWIRVEGVSRAKALFFGFSDENWCRVVTGEGNENVLMFPIPLQ